jgi:hypothetical protein
MILLWIGIKRGIGKWWSARDSNPRPLPCEGNALPAELAPHVDLFQCIDVIIIGFFNKLEKGNKHGKGQKASRSPRFEHRGLLRIGSGKDLRGFADRVNRFTGIDRTLRGSIKK